MELTLEFNVVHGQMTTHGERPKAFDRRIEGTSESAHIHSRQTPLLRCFLAQCENSRLLEAHIQIDLDCSDRFSFYLIPTVHLTRHGRVSQSWTCELGVFVGRSDVRVQIDEITAS